MERLDAAVDLARARALGVNGNGAIAVSRGERHETYLTGLVLDASQGQLRELDPEVQRRLMRSPARRRSSTSPPGTASGPRSNADLSDPRGTVRIFQDLLRAQNDEIRPLGAAQGLATDVPRDASCGAGARSHLALPPRGGGGAGAAGSAAAGGSWLRSTPSPARSSTPCCSRWACASSPLRW